MKKRFYEFGLLFFFVTGFYFNASEAADITNPIKLNVNAKKITNRMYYSNTAGVEVPVNLGWTEKFLLGETGEIAITATITALPTDPKSGDLIIKVDQVTADGTSMDVVSGWLKYDYRKNELTGSVGVFVENDKIIDKDTNEVTIVKSTLATLCLLKEVSPTTTYLFNYYSSLNISGHLILTAVLVDDATATSPQVLGVDVQTIYFNYPGSTTKQNHKFWLDIIQSD